MLQTQVGSVRSEIRVGRRRRRETQGKIGRESNRFVKLPKVMRALGPSRSVFGTPHDDVIGITLFTTAEVVGNEFVDELAMRSECDR